MIYFKFIYFIWYPLFCVSKVFPESNSDNWIQIKNLTLKSMFTNKITIYEKIQPVSTLNKTKILQIPPGL